MLLQMGPLLHLGPVITLVPSTKGSLGLSARFLQRKHNYSKRKKRPNLPFGKNLLHVAGAGVGKFALLVVVVFSFSLGMTFSYLLFS